MKLYVLTDPDLTFEHMNGGEVAVFRTLEEANAMIRESTKREAFPGFDSYAALVKARERYHGYGGSWSYWYDENWDDVRLLEVEVPWLEVKA